jgi:hypothetical protein
MLNVFSNMPYNIAKSRIPAIIELPKQVIAGRAARSMLVVSSAKL